MQVTLTPELEAMVRSKVKAGLYVDESEVVREGLRLLLRHERRERVALERLRAAIAAGEDSGPAEPYDLESILDELDRESPSPGR
jgi:antitoxin ParD1/3/4